MPNQDNRTRELRLKLIRFAGNDLATIGILTVDGQHECYTLEDTVRPPHVKIYGATAIPPGTYRVIVTMSAKFGRLMPLLVGVPDFDGIRIHAGNSVADTEGCILVGKHYEDDRLVDSAKARDALQAKIVDAIANGKRVWIEVVNEINDDL
jgi:hypothetical protein